jgi:hypothetical protein
MTAAAPVRLSVSVPPPDAVAFEMMMILCPAGATVAVVVTETSVGAIHVIVAVPVVMGHGFVFDAGMKIGAPVEDVPVRQ